MAVKTLVCFLVLVVASVELIQVMFDQFKQCTSNGVVECNLRVHKINRTVAALYGNASLKMDLGDNFVTSAVVFHSPLGNNQYNLYPLKIPAVSMCTYVKKYWDDYHPNVVEYIQNVFGPGECPISARVFQFNDMILDSALFSQYMPSGLWKLVFRVSDENTGKQLEVELTFRVYPNGHF